VSRRALVPGSALFDRKTRNSAEPALHTAAPAVSVAILDQEQDRMTR
jgi:hypothetical protein